MNQNGQLFGEASVEDVCTLDKLHELDRELKFRYRVYKRAVSDGKMSQETADRQILVMQAIRADVYKQLEAESAKIAADNDLPYYPHGKQSENNHDQAGNSRGR